MKREQVSIQRRQFLRTCASTSALTLSAATYAQEGNNDDRSKVRPVDDTFEPREWLTQSGLKPEGGTVGVVVGPLDACRLVAYREELAMEGYKFGNAVPSDVFIFSVGEAPHRAQTKIGGLPYLHRSESWPVDSKGKALPFVGQMDFRKSADILPMKLPGELLLVFGRLPSSERSPEVVLLWKSISSSNDAELLSAADVPCKPAFDAFYGSRWRTENYPNAYTDPANERLRSNAKYDTNTASAIFATQISTAPSLLSRNRSSMRRSVVCCFAPVLPASDGPFPFLNVPSPLLEIRGLRDYRYSKEHKFVEQWLTWGDSTSLYILWDEDGGFTHDFIIG